MVRVGTHLDYSAGLPTPLGTQPPVYLHQGEQVLLLVLQLPLHLLQPLGPEVSLLAAHSHLPVQPQQLQLRRGGGVRGRLSFSGEHEGFTRAGREGGRNGDP